MMHWARLRGSTVWTCMPRWERRFVDHALSLETLGITSNCSVSFFLRLRGGSRENVPGQWTCTNCFAERCWPARVRRYRCGELRDNDSAPWNAKKGKGQKGPLGRAPSSVPPTVSDRPHVVRPRGAPPGAGVGSAPSPIPHEDMVKAVKLLQSVVTRGLLQIWEGGNASSTPNGRRG